MKYLSPLLEFEYQTGNQFNMKTSFLGCIQVCQGSGYTQN